MFTDIMAFMPSFYFIIQGAVVTLQLATISVAFGMIIGSILAIFKTTNSSILRLFASGYTSVFRGTPVLVQLSMIYFLPPLLIGIKLSVFAAGIVTFSLNSGAYVSEIIRAGINSVDKGQAEAAKALGIPAILRMKDIILPQAIRNVFPALINELINLIKESALISTLGGSDLMYRATTVSAETYDYFKPIVTAAATYYILVMIISTIGKILEKRLSS
ncbi:MAG: amino acid ABC transporter permease [Rickettsiaceae bacterium]|nr:amino acid ABC transporter permease [Rickettsiaceae bacterium]